MAGVCRRLDLMTHSDRTIVVLLCCLAVLVPAALLILTHESDQSRFERLQVGMSYAEVRAILDRRRSKLFQPACQFTIRVGAIIRSNEHMILVIRDDRSVEEQC